MAEALLYDAIRTPRGKGKKGGALYGTKPVSLLVGLLHELQRRQPNLDPSRIDDVVLGAGREAVERGRVHAKDVGGLVVDDPLRLLVPQDRHAEARFVVGGGRC